jgi:hypothetical protein
MIERVSYNQDDNCLETYNIIVPGLIDFHNHLKFNALPRAVISSKYNHRRDYREAAVGLEKAALEFEELLDKSPELACYAYLFSELKALSGGVTTIQGATGLSQKINPCIQLNLVRNIENPEDFNHSLRPIGPKILNIVDIDGWKKDPKKFKLTENPNVFHRIFLHLAEGQPDHTLQERTDFLPFVFSQAKRFVLINTIGLPMNDYDALGKQGTSFIWSPESNITLYGITNPITRMIDFPIGLGSDWSLTGSFSLWEEMQKAYSISQKLKWNISAKRIFQMATAGKEILDLPIGELKVGHFADFFLVSKKKKPHKNPYKYLLTKASRKNIKLVVIDGKPIYGSFRAIKDIDPTFSHFTKVSKGNCQNPKFLRTDVLQGHDFRTLEKELNSAVKKVIDHNPGVLFTDSQNNLASPNYNLFPC